MAFDFLTLGSFHNFYSLKKFIENQEIQKDITYTPQQRI